MTSLSTFSDQELLLQLKEDDRFAFDEIYNRYWKFLFTASYNATKNRDDSLDVCQIVFLWLWENRKHIEINTNLKAYLYTAVKYKIANLIRHGKVRESLFDNLHLIDIRTYKETELEIKELKNFIDQLINKLPGKCREVFLLSRTEHLTHKQIAERLGITEKTVDDHITRALQKLRVPLGKLASVFLLF